MKNHPCYGLNHNVDLLRSSLPPHSSPALRGDVLFGIAVDFAFRLREEIFSEMIINSYKNTILIRMDQAALSQAFLFRKGEA